MSIQKINNENNERVSKVGVVLFILTMLFICGLISIPIMLLCSLGDIIQGISGWFGSLPFFG